MAMTMQTVPLRCDSTPPTCDVQRHMGEYFRCHINAAETSQQRTGPEVGERRLVLASGDTSGSAARLALGHDEAADSPSIARSLGNE